MFNLHQCLGQKICSHDTLDLKITSFHSPYLFSLFLKNNWIRNYIYILFYSLSTLFKLIIIFHIINSFCNTCARCMWLSTPLPLLRHFRAAIKLFIGNWIAIQTVNVLLAYKLGYLPNWINSSVGVFAWNFETEWVRRASLFTAVENVLEKESHDVKVFTVF